MADRGVATLLTIPGPIPTTDYQPTEGILVGTATLMNFRGGGSDPPPSSGLMWPRRMG